MKRYRKSADVPPGFCKGNFLLNLCRRIDQVRYAQTEMSAPAHLYLELLANACLNEYEHLRCEARCWTWSLIMTALTENDPLAMSRFRERLEADPVWWPIVSMTWRLHSKELAQNLDEELPRYLKAEPVCTPEQLEKIRGAVMRLTPRDIFGVAFVEERNEPLITTNFNERAEVERLGDLLVELVHRHWPVCDEEEDPWDHSAGSGGELSVFARPWFSDDGAPDWNEALSYPKPGLAKPSLTEASTLPATSGGMATVTPRRAVRRAKDEANLNQRTRAAARQTLQGSNRMRRKFVSHAFRLKKARGRRR